MIKKSIIYISINKNRKFKIETLKKLISFFEFSQKLQKNIIKKLIIRILINNNRKFIIKKLFFFLKFSQKL